MRRLTLTARRDGIRGADGSRLSLLSLMAIFGHDEDVTLHSEGFPVISVDSQRSTDNITIRQGDTAVIRLLSSIISTTAVREKRIHRIRYALRFPVISVDSQRSTDNITIRQGDTAVIRLLSSIISTTAVREKRIHRIRYALRRVNTGAHPIR
ncbi:limbic system-associated membrane -like protein [Labeo rohita]|uniref:Limbic system-associated membrane-like protein n=1 Tax=Labeo rohita TaxID=84645 RepID=A0A498L1Y8_LABRO|nr:limbic system-associated membrane -like protein [Labeo rohita]